MRNKKKSSWRLWAVIILSAIIMSVLPNGTWFMNRVTAVEEKEPVQDDGLIRAMQGSDMVICRTVQGETVTVWQLLELAGREKEEFTEAHIQEEIRYGEISSVYELEREYYPVESAGDRIFLVHATGTNGQKTIFTFYLAVAVKEEYEDGNQKEIYQTAVDENGAIFVMTDRTTQERKTRITYPDGSVSSIYANKNGVFRTFYEGTTSGDQVGELHVIERAANRSMTVLSFDGVEGTITFYSPDGRIVTCLLGVKNGKIYKYRETYHREVEKETHVEDDPFPETVSETTHEISETSPSAEKEPETESLPETEEQTKEQTEAHVHTWTPVTHVVTHPAVTHEVEHAAVTHEVEHAAVTHVVYHPAGTHVVTHPAVTHTVEHAAVTHEVEHAAVMREVEHPAVTREVWHEAITHEVEHAAVTHEVEHPAVTREVWHDAVMREVEHPAITHEVDHPAVTHEEEHPAETHEVYHEETGHYESVQVKEAWEETVCTKEAWDEPEWHDLTICNGCKQIVYGDYGSHILDCDKWGSYHSEWGQTGTIHHDAEYTTVYHEAEYEDQWVVDVPAWTEMVVDQEAWIETVVDQEAWTETVVDVSAWTETIVDQEAWAETVVDEEAWTEIVVDVPAWTETIVDQEAWIETVVDEEAWTETVVDIPAWTETVVDQEAWTETIIDVPAWTETIVEQEAWTEIVVDQEAWTETVVDVPAWTETVVDKEAWTETIVTGYICQECGATR